MNAFERNDVPAVVGMACRLPGGDGLDDFWRLLVSGGDAVVELPPDRLDRDVYFDARRGEIGKTYSSLGGLVSARPIDPEIRALAPHIFDDADPCHQILCETVGFALRHAGLKPHRHNLGRIGIYVGHSGGSAASGENAFAAQLEEVVAELRSCSTFDALSNDDQAELLNKTLESLSAKKPILRADGGPRYEANCAASIVARAFGFDGPRHVIDAACASSLSALQAAALALERGEIGAAVVCGASYAKTDSLILFSQAQSCSASGTRPFDDAADGLIGSEGYVALIIKPLRRAKADGDTIHAVVRGLGVSSDGRGRSLWAPRREGQLEAVRRAYPADLDPATVQYVEMHATSTQVGDATELTAVADFFRERSGLSRRIPIGSVKSNIGHTLETAGLAGLLKIILALRHRVLPPSINIRELNRNVDWNKLPFDVVRTPQPWPQPAEGTPRRAAVNAFGIGGLNVHAIVEEYLPGRPEAEFPATRIEPLSTPPSADAVAIVGRGLVAPGARNIAEFRELRRSGRDPKTIVTSDRWDVELACRHGRRGRPLISTALGGFVREYAFDWRKRKIPPKQIETANPLQFMLLDAAEQALAEAGGEAALGDRRRTSVVIGTVFGGDFGNELHVGLRLAELRAELGRAAALRRLTPAEIQALLNEFQAAILRRYPALRDETGSFTSSTLASRLTKTFDLMGGALAVDASDCSSTAALALACDQLLTGRVDSVFCAGAQRSMGIAAYEALLLRGKLLGSDPERPDEGYVPAEAAAVVVLKRLADARAAGDRIFGVVRGVGSYAADVAAEAILGARRRAALRDCSDCGAEIVDVDYRLQALRAAQRRAIATGSNESSPSRTSDLVAQLGHAQAAHGLLEIIDASLHFERLAAESRPIAAIEQTTLAESGLAHHVRLEPAPAVVVTESTPAETSRFTEAETPLGRPSLAAAGLAPRQRGRAVAAFPGQGSRISRRTAEFVAGNAAATALVAQADAMLAVRGLPSFGALIGRGQAVAADVRLSQLSVLVADLAYFVALRTAGVRFDWVTGHSYGEIVSLAAAEVVTLEEAIDLTLARSAAVERCGAPVSTLVAVAASPVELQPLLAEAGLKLYITHHNAPRQTVVAGPDDVVKKFLQLAERENLGCSRLEVPLPYHTPLLKSACNPFRDQLARIEFRPPSLPILSNVTNRFTAEPEELRDNLVRQLTKPVRYVELVERLVGSGAGVLVEVGPGHVLTGLHRQIALHSVATFACEESTTLNDAASAIATVLRGDAQSTFQARPQSRSAVEVIAPQLPAAHAVTVPTQTASFTGKADDRDSFDATASRKAQARARSATANAPAHPVTTSASPPSHPDRLRLADFLIDFVVEQTGYPRDVVDLDADLEADLGIDSIKKAQLFGELREFFPEIAVERSKLGAFTTLRQVAGLLDSAGGKAEWLNCGEPAAAPGGRLVAPDAADARVERFLVDFVVEQTGYPRDVVDLDADLEADLGIDSIKKAQIFGELREHYAAELPKDLKPSNFGTLRDFLNLVAASRNGSAAAQRPSVPTTSASIAVAVPSQLVTDAPPFDRTPSVGRASRSVASIEVLRVDGSRFKIGEAHGRAYAESIRAMLRRYADVDRAILPAGLDKLRPRDVESLYDADELEELAGIAAGAEVAVENILAHNVALATQTDAGCVQFAVTAACNGRMIHAVNEDSPLTLIHGAQLAGLIQLRPGSGPTTFANVTVVGQTAGINGLNSAGLGVTSTKLLDRRGATFTEPTTGLLHAVLVKRILSTATDIEAACDVVREFPRLGAWSLCLSHGPSDRLCYIEYEGSELQIQCDVPRVVAANHSLLAAKQPVPRHSRERYARLAELVDAHETIDDDDARRILQDRFDRTRGAETAHPTMNTLRRVDNLVGVVMRPAAGELQILPHCAASSAQYVSAKLDVDRPHSLDRSAAASAAATLTKRFVMRAIERPHPAAPNFAALKLRGNAVVLGDNPFAVELARLVVEQGRRVLRLPTDDVDAANAALERFWVEHGPAPHLFFAGPCDADAATRFDAAQFAGRRTRGVSTPYFACRTWAQLVTAGRLNEQTTIGALTRLGGDFGFTGRVEAVESGAVNGLMKALWMEWFVQGFRGMPFKSLDVAPGTSPPAAAESLLLELANPSVSGELSYVDGKRLAVRCVRRPLPCAADAPPSPSAPRRGGVWICTGGARGITAFVARELGRRYGLRLHLIGTAPVPDVHPEHHELADAGRRKLRESIMRTAEDEGRSPRKAWQAFEKALEIDRALREFAAAGVPATYRSCDVADRAALAAVVDHIRRDDGPIAGILHGAGFGNDARFDRKKPDEVERCFAAKVDGAAHLMELTRSDPLAHFVAFGSISGRFGANGHTDYSAANEMLAKQVDWFRRARPECRSTTFHWHAWDDFGMAVKPETRLTLELASIEFMPSREGLAHLVAELEAGLPEPEVLITSDQYAAAYQPPDADPAVAPAEPNSRGIWLGATYRLTERAVGTQLHRRTATFEKAFDPTTAPFLTDHRLQDRPLLPVVVGLEMIVAAAEASAAAPVGIVRNLTARQGVRFPDDRPRTIRATADCEGGSTRVSLAHDVVTRDGRPVESNRMSFTAECLPPTDELRAAPPSAATSDVAPWEPIAYPERPAPFYLGPALRCLKEVQIGTNSLVGRIVAESAERLAGSAESAAGWRVPCAALDAALYAVGLWAWRRLRPGTALPKSFDEIKLGRVPRPDESCTLVARPAATSATSCDSDEAVFDFTLRGDDGATIADVAGYRIAWLKQ